MPATPEAGPGSARRAPRRRPAAVGLSLVLHVALLSVLTRMPLPVSEAHVPSPAPTPIVWLRELPVREAPPAPPEPAAVEPPPEARAEAIEPPAERATPPTPKRAARRRPPAEAPAPRGVEPAPQPAPPPRIDWEKERRSAVRDTIDGPGPGYRTFTDEDLPQRKPQPLPIEPAPPPMVTDHCVIFKNRFQAMLLGMVGICVRDAKGDLFADARPAYLDEHPVCHETRPDSPGAVASDGRVISTVKCVLVADDDDVTEVKVEVDLEAP